VDRAIGETAEPQRGTGRTQAIATSYKLNTRSQPH